MKVAFIGLGVMGYPMAGHLQNQAGKLNIQVSVYNRTFSKAKQWANEFGGQAYDTPAKAAEDCDIAFVCVGNDDDVRSVIYGEDGVLNSLKPGGVLVDHTTASAELARELETSSLEQGKGFVDAPVSGGQAGAENGVLTVMCGGEQAHFDRVYNIMSAYARFSKLLGPAGSGQLTKMVNQICIAGLVQGLSEGLHFARSAGLDIQDVVETISKGAAGSWQMENRHKTMESGEYEHGFAVDWMRKDLDIALTEARKNGSNLPVTALVDQFYSEVQAIGGNRWDTSSLMARLEKMRKS